ncbi:MAG TPA: CoA pyrophosphatase [Polyangiaceae bacterium]|jgi:8-oxo-dGTP pyrophosphatase MutT (NUDIX family)
MPASFQRERLRQALADSPLDAPLAGQRCAAIALVLLEVDTGLEALLIERAERSGDPWSGHMALPGGHLEERDVDLGAAAERETLEEVGLDLRRFGERLGRLSDSAPVQGVPLAVRPFVYLLQTRPVLTLSDEVRQALWVPIAPLQRGERRTSFELSRAGERRQFPAWDIDGHIVWGLTYRVLAEFFRRFNEVSASESATLDNSQQPR